MSARRESTVAVPSTRNVQHGLSPARHAVPASGRRFPGLGRIVAFFGVIVALAYGLDAVISSGLRRIPTSKYGALNQVIEGKVNADIVINGSSRALVHYDPRHLEQATGLTAFNLGMNGTHIDVQLAILRTYLKHNRKPRLVIQNLEAFSFVTTRPGEIYDPALYIPYLREPELYRSLLRIDPAVRKWKYIPLYGYAVEDLRFTWVRGLLAWGEVHPREDYIKGFNPRNLSWTEDFDRFKATVGKGITYEIEPAGVQALRDLIAVCRDAGIGILLVYSPEYVEAQNLVQNRAEIFATFQRLRAETGVSFWDLSNSPLSGRRELFYNSQHLNAAGADNFSQQLGQRLRSEPLLRSNSPKKNIP